MLRIQLLSGEWVYINLNHVVSVEQFIGKSGKAWTVVMSNCLGYPVDNETATDVCDALGSVEAYEDGDDDGEGWKTGAMNQGDA